VVQRACNEFPEKAIGLRSRGDLGRGDPEVEGCRIPRGQIRERPPPGQPHSARGRCRM